MPAASDDGDVRRLAQMLWDVSGIESYFTIVSSPAFDRAKNAFVMFIHPNLLPDGARRPSFTQGDGISFSARFCNSCQGKLLRSVTKRTVPVTGAVEWLAWVDASVSRFARLQF
jgi:hypothetical protein